MINKLMGPRKIISAATYFACVLLFLNPRFATTQQAKHRAVVSNSSATLKVFDPATAKLPPNFTGIDLRSLATALEKVNTALTKSEYETLDEYKTRVSGARQHDLITPMLHLGDQIAVVLDPTRFVYPSALTVKYDAEISKFDVDLVFQKKNRYGDGSRDNEAYTIRQITYEFSREKYLGENAFGASVSVDSCTDRTYGVAVSPAIWPLTASTDEVLSRTFSLQVSTPRSQAARVRNELRVALIGRIGSPTLFKDFIHSEPTVDDPYDHREDLTFINLVPSEILIFRKDTGEILTRLGAER